MIDPTPGELEYLEALHEHRYDEAKWLLLKAIVFEKQIGVPAMLAGLCQRLGTVMFRQGDQAAALCIYELSEEIDPGSLLCKLEYARFLFQEAGDKDSATKKCMDLIALAQREPFGETDDDFSSEQYIDAAKRILEKIDKSSG